MLKRKIINELINWKNEPEKMCCMVKGARQVGKTFIIKKFAADYYENFIDINFDENESYKSIFADSLNADDIYKQISLHFPDVDIVSGKTLLFLDEIQNCPRARTALKFLSLDKRIDVIASGSMLGINYKEVPSNPVGYVHHVEMHSLDFEEYLWAHGIKEDMISDLRDTFYKRSAVLPAIHDRMLELFREYIVVGGMPRVVQEFVKNKNFSQVLRLQRQIIDDYLDDIVKYAEGAEKTKARACFLSVPSQLSKDYKKFQYSVVEKGGSSRKYGGSLMWLHDANIISFCHNLTRPELPLQGNMIDDVFKVYMRDTGLLVAMLEQGSQKDILEGNLGIYKGAIYENMIADIFKKLGKPLYYFEKNSTLEIDFIIRYQGKVTAVEVKSSENTKSKSLAVILNKREVHKGIRLSTKNLGSVGKIDSIPLYMAIFLEDELVDCFL